MKQRPWLKRTGFIAFVSINIALIALVILPAPIALGLTTTIKTDKELQGLDSKFKLGELVVLKGEVSLAQGEVKDVKKVTLDIQGRQPLMIDLPLTVGNNQDLTNQLPKDNQNNSLGSLKVDVTKENILTVFGYGYGYAGYSSGNSGNGSAGGTGGGKLKYTIKYRPPVFLFPSPAALAGPPNQPTKVFSVPPLGGGGGGGGGGGTGAPGFQTVPANFLFNTPPAPGVPPNANILGLAFDAGAGQLLILVDGGSSSANDVVLVTDPFGGFLFDFMDTGVTDAQAVAWVPGGDVYVLTKGPEGKKIKRVKAGSPSTGNVAEKVLGTDSLEGKGLDVGPTGKLMVTELQTNPAGTTTIRTIDPLTGNELSVKTDISVGPTGGGFNASAAAADGSIFGAFNKKVMNIDSTGILKNVFEFSNLADIQGLELIPAEFFGTSEPRLFMGDGNAVYWFELPPPGGGGFGGGGFGGGGMPTDIAVTLDKVFISIDTGPSDDKIIVTDYTGNKLGEFATGFGGVDSLEVMSVSGSPFLWFVDNNSFPKKLVKRNLDGTTPAGTNVFSLPSFVGDIGDITVKDSKLILAERFNDKFYTVSSTGGVEGTLLGSDGNFNDPFFPPFGVEGFAFQPSSSPAVYWGSKFTTLFRFDPANGKLIGGDFVTVPPFNIVGLARQGSQLWMVDQASNQVFNSTFPGTLPPSPTTEGDYSAFLKATVGEGVVNSSVGAYTLEKVGTLAVAITSPQDGAGVATTSVTVQGTVNDPTVKQLSLGAALAEVVLFGNPEKTGASTLATTADKDQYTKTGLWRFATGFNFQGQILNDSVAHYGKEEGGNANYNTFGPFGGPSPNNGDLDTASYILGIGTTASFDTKWDTEPGFSFDKKLVRWKSGNVSTVVAQITDIPPQVQQPGPPGAPPFFFPDFNAQPGTVYGPLSQQMFPGAPNHKMVFVPQFIPGFAHVVLELDKLLPSSELGKTGVLEFTFDTVDGALNDFDGWLVKNIRVDGPGSSGKNIIVDPDTLTWSTTVDLSEGENTITVTAQRTAYDPQTKSASAKVFLDNVAPIVKLDPLATATNNPVLAVSGSFVEDTPDLLEVLVNDKVVFTKKSFSNTFSTTINLAAGSNTIKARLTDKAGKVGEATASIMLDTTAPSLIERAIVYETGEISAIPGATVVFAIDVTDTNGSGVNTVVFTPPGGGQDQPLIKATDIPAAIRDKWGTTAAYLLPTTIPNGLPPGEFSVTIKGTDKAGNTSTKVVKAKIVATSEAFNRYLMPGFNFVATPLQCTGALVADGGVCNSDLSYDIAALLQKVVPNAAATFDPDSNPSTPVRLADVVDTISAYDGGDSPANFKVFTTDAAADTLLKIEPLRGYIVKTKDAAFKKSAPIAVGFPETPTPIKMTFRGELIKPGDLPRSRHLVQKWNLVADQSEHISTVGDLLAGVSVPQRTWANFLTWVNELIFKLPSTPSGQPTLEITLGAFKGKTSTDSVDPGQSAWVFMTAEGDIVGSFK